MVGQLPGGDAAESGAMGEVDQTTLCRSLCFKVLGGRSQSGCWRKPAVVFEQGRLDVLGGDRSTASAER
jgi:hypothetical protein